MSQHTKAVLSEHHHHFKNIYANVRYLRKQQKLSQEELAHKANMCRNTIACLENKNSVYVISLEVLFCIADALGVNPDVLLKDPPSE